VTEAVHYEVVDAVAVLTVDRPPVNAIDVSIRRGLIAGVERAEADAAVKAILIVAAGRTFMSGADLSELGGTIQAPGYYEALGRIEASSKPVVASLHGMALGGGLETALASHYRVAEKGAKMGLPEITLGITPGAGGTQRMPRVVGALKTLELMIQGAPIGAEDARAIGLIDDVVEGSARDGGLAFAKRLIAEGKGPRPTRDMPVRTEGYNTDAVAAVLKANARSLKGRTTQHDVVKTVQAAVDLPFDEGIKAEDEIGKKTLKARESEALRHVFFAERECGRIPGLKGVEPAAIKKAAVVGAGTMGGGIAMAFANSGIPVVLIEVKQEALDRGLGVIRGNYDVTVKRGRMTLAEVDQRMGLITGALDASAASEADVAVEAVFENMELKKSILANLDKHLPKHAIIGSNTSTLSVTELATATNRPEQVVGLHFFSPAHVMRLLEIVRGGKTTNQTLVTALELARKIKKIGVVSGDAFGFIGNKMMQDGYFREAEQLLLEGASAEQIDRVMEAWGMAMGPNKVNDMAGVDVGTLVRHELAKREDRPKPYFEVSDAITPLGRLGQKTGKGIYRYEPGDRTAHNDPEVEALILKLSADFGIERREISDAEVEERCILPLVNEGAKLLETSVAYRASDIDVVWTSGYGFPRHLGGPMFYGDTLGLKHVLARIEHYHAKLGHYWQPSNLLRLLADSGRTFTDWDKAGGK
jgi:3-hydroxyacyl-CoA dehydrogenase